MRLSVTASVILRNGTRKSACARNVVVKVVL